MVESEALLSHLEGLASKHFGLESLRPQQKEVFVALQQHRQVLAMLPTGSGKTLLYALGSLLFTESLTIVICPLIALMRDQYQRMVDAGIVTAAIYSEQPDDERRQAFRLVLQGSAKLLFVSPERFCLPSFQKVLRRLKLGMVVVDEAHCVVTWGHSFRPEYSQLAGLLKNLNIPRILALTATASRTSRELIREMVFPDPAKVSEVIDKPLKDNIRVESVRVYSEDQRWLEVLRILKETVSSKSILYFSRREQCQNAAQELRKCGYNAIVYHAGLQREFRKSVEEYLRQSERPVVICATLAFGMGIDLPNVQLIVVVGFPGNIEEMFQMMGRAGRKGETARAAVVWSGSDPKKRAFQFERTLPETDELMQRLVHISTLLPGNQQTVLVQKNQLARLIRPLVKSDKDLSSAIQSLASALSMLGLGGAMDSTRSDWANVKLERPDVLMMLMAELPVGPSRRRMVLEWIQNRVGSGVNNPGPRQMSFALNEIAEDLQIQSYQILEVFRHYAEKQKMKFQLISMTEVQDSLLLSGDLDDFRRQVPKYQRWRSALNQSLHALSAFVTAENCRMSVADKFFLPRGLAYASASRAQCGRCDLCEAQARSLAHGRNVRIASTLTLSESERLR